ncbi:MAG: TRAP transporter substrate-binding protein DctP [Thermodesulfobacteriota bacterium]
MRAERTLVFLGLALTVALIGVLGLGGLTPAAAEDVYRMKIQSAYPRGDVSMELLKYFADQAKARSNGKLLISVYADPELVPGEQLFEATKKGTLDMLHAVPAMWGGILPIGEVEFGLPYAWKIPGGEKRPITETAAELREFFYGSGFVDLLRAEYAKQGMYWLDLHTYGPIFTLATKPIHTCADLQGKKMRMEGAWNDYYNMMGARGTNLPGTDAYMGLKLGTLDASQWDVSAIVGLNWHEVAPYWLRGTDPEHVEGNILVCQKSWENLPDDMKKALSGAAEDYWNELIKVHIGELEKVAELVKAGKVIESWIDEECQKKHAEVAYQLWDEIGKRDEAAAKAIALIKKWRGIQ